MKYIANILTDKKFIDNDLYNVVSNKEELVDNIPTLVIGWGYTKEQYPNANILDWEIEKNIFWTFGKRERNQRYDDTLKKFREHAIKVFIKSIDYTFINVILNHDLYSSLLDILNLCDEMNAYVVNDMLYLSCSEGRTVYGISLRDIEFLGYDKKTVFAILHKNKSVKMVDYNLLSWDIKDALKNCIYVVPCLF